MNAYFYIVKPLKCERGILLRRLACLIRRLYIVVALRCCFRRFFEFIVAAIAFAREKYFVSFSQCFNGMSDLLKPYSDCWRHAIHIVRQQAEVFLCLCGVTLYFTGFFY